MLAKTARNFVLGAVVAGGALVLAAGSGFAALGGSDGGTGTPVCTKGMIYDPGKKICVKQKAGIVDDDALADYAYALIGDERFDEALDVLDLMENSNTAEALNYRGYASRKLGRVEEGIGYYLKAVQLDADYNLAREYLGEAYVLIGRVDLAREQLHEIAKRCGTTCEPYEDLAEAIEEGI